MDSQYWKDRLAREVFDWQVYALEQTAEENAKYWADDKCPPAEFCRAVGWQEAIRVVCTAFTREGVVGTCLTLAADMDGAVGSWHSYEEGGWIDVTQDMTHTTPPDEQLKVIQTQLKKSKWQYEAQIPPKQWFHGAPGALSCAINALTRIIQEICVHKPRNRYPSFGHGEPEMYIPGYYYYTCEKCGAEVPSVAPLNGTDDLIPTYTGEEYDHD